MQFSLDSNCKYIQSSLELVFNISWVISKSLSVQNSTVKIAREVLDVAARMIHPGVTTDEIDQAVHEATIAAGACFEWAFVLHNLWMIAYLFSGFTLYVVYLSCRRISIPSQLSFFPKVLLHVSTSPVQILWIYWEWLCWLRKRISFSFLGQLMK